MPKPHTHTGDCKHGCKTIPPSTTCYRRRSCCQSRSCHAPHPLRQGEPTCMGDGGGGTREDREDGRRVDATRHNFRGRGVCEGDGWGGSVPTPPPKHAPSTWRVLVFEEDEEEGSAMGGGEAGAGGGTGLGLALPEMLRRIERRVDTRPPPDPGSTSSSRALDNMVPSGVSNRDSTLLCRTQYLGGSHAARGGGGGGSRGKGV